MTFFIAAGVGSYAQTRSLKNISKIELITAGAWIDGYYKKVEIVIEDGKWNSYQTRLASNGYSRDRKAINDSARTFLMNVDETLLKQFNKLIATPDSVIREELFNIKTEGLIAQVDSTIASEIKYGDLKEQPPIEWKNDFIKAVKSKGLVSKAFHDAMHQMRMDDRSHYYIIIADKFGNKDTIAADANSELYYLPWRLKGKESYNPNITKIFEHLSGNYAFEQKEQKHLYYNVIWEFYNYMGFKAKLDWDRFEREQPEVHATASKTLLALKFSNYNKGIYTFDMGFSGFFTSKILPSFIEISCNFSRQYPESGMFDNKREEQLINWYKSGSFFFDYMKDQPHAAMIFGGGSIKKEQYDELEKHYPELANVDRSKIQWFTLLKDRDYNNSSLWLLLPDNRLILTRYGGKLVDNYQDKLAFIPSKFYRWKTSNVCIVFDKNGKKVGGTDVPFDVKRTD